MPLLRPYDLAPDENIPVPEEPNVPPDTGPAKIVDADWTAPDGTVLPLMNNTEPGAHLLPGVLGWGAAPREITRSPLAIGGAYARWSHAEERMISLPLHLHAGTPDEFWVFRRDVTNLFLQTATAAGIPRPGWLRVIRSDGSWRRIACHYVEGLEWNDEQGKGIYYDSVVVQLVAPDPWWYGEEDQVLEWRLEPTRDYLNPYETVSTDRTLGAQTLTIAGDAPASPIWRIYGPATSVTVRYAENGPGWTFGAIAEGEIITIDVTRNTVTDQTGANRIGDLAWPTSSLYQLQPGRNNMFLSLSNGVEMVSAINLFVAPRYETA